MSATHSSYTLSTTTSLSFEEAVGRVRQELAAEGFGVLSEIDVQATLKRKLGVQREPYLILGACNPPLAHAALEAEPELGALLPCNVVVYQQQGQTHIAAVDAEQMLSIVDNDHLCPPRARCGGAWRRWWSALPGRGRECAHAAPATQSGARIRRRAIKLAAWPLRLITSRSETRCAMGS